MLDSWMAGLFGNNSLERATRSLNTWPLEKLSSSSPHTNTIFTEFAFSITVLITEAFIIFMSEPRLSWKPGISKYRTLSNSRYKFKIF
ncbi:unnamed protein product [Blepharisma stoltei]|uniref:Uncharacterized protein n=1 Tax=Blepharisma stoltei TaxID=1481888 RepID=A0AAU9JXY9_9CILI|nr:unnamed protein product [Blepharisma stoltei]